MKTLKVLFVVLVAAGLTLWSASLGVLPLPQAAEDLAFGVVGTLGLAAAAAFRGVFALLLPVLMVLRVLAVPLALAGLAYLAFARLPRRR